METIREKAKTSLRLKYEAETVVLRRETGSLEEIRVRLGFSRRKICQTLMVDPSAWSRWTAEGSDAPPHIYQALRWYLDSKTHQNQKFETYWAELKAENRHLHEELHRMRRQLGVLRWMWIPTVAVILASILTYVSLVIFSK